MTLGKFPVQGGTALAVLLMLSGCASGPSGGGHLRPAPPPSAVTDLTEMPPPEGPWREHMLARCLPPPTVSTSVEMTLGTCSELFRGHSGSDAIVELESALATGHDEPLILLTLGQLYVLAGQGDPELMPNEGPAADVGDWARNQSRLLHRAITLLERARLGRPDDAAVDYLIADALRAGGEAAAADSVAALGRTKCTGGRSFRMLELYQQLNRHPPRYLGGASPVFPARAVQRRLGGDVVVDLLLDPDARLRQTVIVSTPDPSLAQAAVAALEQGDFEAGRVGKYPVWSWLRVTLAFNLAD